MTRQPESVDQSDRIVPVNLRQSGRTPTELLISTRVRKSPYWHLSHEAGCWRATVYNRIYHPRGYVRPEDGGAAAEYEALTKHVTMWNVAVERQIRVMGPDAERFTDYVITRDATRIEPMHAKYVILCNERGGILNDPVLLQDRRGRVLVLPRGLRHPVLAPGGQRRDEDGRRDRRDRRLPGADPGAEVARPHGRSGGEDSIRDIPYYGLMEAEIAGCGVVISQSGFLGGEGLRDLPPGRHPARRRSSGTRCSRAGKAHQLMVIAPGHQRRIQAGILSWGQDIDHETVPFQCNLAYQVPRKKSGDYIGRAALERMREEIDAGRPPFSMVMAGMTLGGKPIDDYAPDFWLVSDADGGDPIGYLTSPWYAPELGTNIAMGYVPVGKSGVGTELTVWLPDEYASEPGKPDRAEVCEVPFRPSVNPSAREVARARGEDATRLSNRVGTRFAQWGQREVSGWHRVRVNAPDEDREDPPRSPLVRQRASARPGAALPRRAAGLSRTSGDARPRRAGRARWPRRPSLPILRPSPRRRSLLRTSSRGAGGAPALVHARRGGPRRLSGRDRVARARSGLDLRPIG